MGNICQIVEISGNVSEYTRMMPDTMGDFSFFSYYGLKAANGWKLHLGITKHQVTPREIDLIRYLCWRIKKAACTGPVPHLDKTDR